MDADEIGALTFDCYGTLIDWEAGLLSVLRRWASRRGAGASDDELLEAFARAESRAEQVQPFRLYPDVLRAAHAQIARDLGVAPEADAADELARSVGAWRPFRDTVPALERLARRFPLVVVSNVDRRSFARTRRLLEVDFAAVVTAEDVGAYKPDPRMFVRALEVLRGLGVEARAVVHVAQSLYHDHVPAKALGLRTAWVDRRRGRSGSGATSAAATAVGPDCTVGSLEELARLLVP
jgi:putative hydrolase of the HAD superfamily